MAKVTFRNYFEDTSKFIEIEEDTLLDAVVEYARIQEKDVYKAIRTERVLLFLNDKLIPIDDWFGKDVLPNDEIIITPAYEDVEGGWVQIALGVTLIAVGIPNPVLFGVEFGTYLIGAGVAMTLGGVSALLFQPTLPDMSYGSSSTSQSYSWTGISTTCKADTPIPVVYGKHAVGGNIISVFTETDGDDQYLNVLLALCEGEIEGICQYSDDDQVMTTNDPDDAAYPVYGPAIWIDDQPLYEYDDVEWDYRVGTNNQTKISGFEGARTQYSDGRKVTVSGIEYVTNTDVDQVTLNFTADGMYKAEGGEIVDVDTTFKIEYKEEAGGSWTTFKTVTWSEKATVTVYHSETIKFDTRTVYRIRVRRTDGGESDSDYVTNPLDLASVLEVVDGNFRYPNTALASFRIRATDQISGGVPNIRVLIKGLKVEVPALSGSEAFDDVVYDSAQSRFEYNGFERTWDGTTFETEYTHNAMCCVRDLLLNARYGLGKYITSDDLYSTGINKAIKLCHIEYDNSYVNDDHYHTWNGVLDTPQEAFTAIYEMCSGFRCWPTWYNGTFNFIIDADDTPVHTIAVSNTIEFKQTFAPLSEIPYRLLGQFTELEDHYNLRTIIVEADDNTLNEINEQTIGLKGITDKDKAERELTYKLNKVINCTHTVNFKCGLDYIHATAGDIIYLENDLPQFGQGGRILTYDSSTLTITLDKDYTMGAGTDTIRYQSPDNTWISGTIVSAAGQVITLSAWPGTNPAEDAVYTITNDDSTVKEFRVLAVERTMDNELEVSALEHISTVYTDPSIRVITDNYSGLPNPFEVPDAPIRVGVCCASIYDGIGFELTAQPPSGTSDVVDIVVEMNDGDDEFYTPIATIPVATGTYKVKYIDNNLALNHTYYFRFYCRTRYKTGVAVETEHTLYKIEFALDPPDGIKIQGQDANSHDWDGMDLTIQWNAVGSVYWADAIVAGYTVEIYKNSSDKSSNLLRTDFTSNAYYTYDYDKNYIDTNGDPQGVLVFVLYTKSTNGVESAGSSPFKATNQNPDAVTSLTTELFMGGVQFLWDTSPESDFKQYEYKVTVQESDWDQDWTTLDMEWVSLTANNFYRQLTDSEKSTYTTPAIFVRVRVRDLFGNVSTENNTWGIPESLNIAATEIEDFALDASKLFTKIPILSGDIFQADDPSSGYVSWNAHYLYYNGNEYSIAAGNTNEKYIYWKYDGTMPEGGAGESNSSSYSTSDEHPGDAELLEADRDFIIAVNVDGQYTMAWNSIANQVVGTSYIMDLAVEDAKISDLSADKIKANSVMTPGVYIGYAILTEGTDLDTALPTHLIDFVQAPTTDGLYLTSTYLGYVNSGTWKTYMTSDGDFYLYGKYGISGDGYLVWDYSKANLQIKGTVTVTGGKLGDVEVDTLNNWLYPGTTYINGGYIRTNTIDAESKKARSITAIKLAAATITTNEIAADTITADNIAANTITADEIAANTITADEIAANTITALNIDAGTITADEIYSDAGLVGAQIAVNEDTLTFRVHKGGGYGIFYHNLGRKPIVQIYYGESNIQNDNRFRIVKVTNTTLRVEVQGDRGIEGEATLTLYYI